MTPSARLATLLPATLLFAAALASAQQPHITPPTIDHSAPPDASQCHNPGSATLNTKLHFTVDTEGKTHNVVVAESSGVPCFDQAAIASAQAFTFHPALAPDGTPVSVPYTSQISFQPGAGPASPGAGPANSSPKTTGAFTAAGSPVYECNLDGKGPITPPRQIAKGNLVPPAELSGHYEATLVFIVNEQGTTEAAKILKTTDSHLDKWALASVAEEHFHPAMLAGKPVAVELTINLALDK